MGILIKFEDINFKELNFPQEIIIEMKKWKHIYKSPFSNSFYNSDEITWDHKPDKSLRVSDHWNFRTRDGKKHCETLKQVECKNRISIGVFLQQYGKYRILQSIYTPSYKNKMDYVENVLKSKENIELKTKLKKKKKNRLITCEFYFDEKNKKSGIVDLYTGRSLRVINDKGEIVYRNNYIETKNDLMQIDLFENGKKIQNIYLEDQIKIKSF